MSDDKLKEITDDRDIWKELYERSENNIKTQTEKLSENDKKIDKLTRALLLIVKKSQPLLTNPNCADISSIAEKALK